MLAEFGEASDDEESLPLGRRVDFFMFEDPRVAVWNEDRVESGG